MASRRCAVSRGCSRRAGVAPMRSAASDRPSSRWWRDRKSTRLNSSHSQISYAVFCLNKKNVEAYLRQSEQLDSALGCEVVVDSGGEVVASGGVLVQALPGGEPDLIRAVQHQLRTSVL